VKAKRDRGWCSFHEKRRTIRVVLRQEGRDLNRVAALKITCFIKRGVAFNLNH